MKKFISLSLTVIIMMCALIMPSRAVEDTPQAGEVSTGGSNLNVRRSADISSEIISSLKDNSLITLKEKNGYWWKIEYAKGKYGYSHSDYIKTVSSIPATVKISYGTLNVRSGAGTSYSVKGALLKGDTVLVLSKTSAWSKILYHGTKTGYVSSQYLSEISSPSVSYPAVRLSVPSFKQTDERWKNVVIGTSGKTIGQIGCVTTAIAMIESYRAGKTIYPDAMSKKLSYNSSGSVYWPSDYIVATTSAGYLSKIYNQLREGKAVLFGAKNSSGTQHWVVITGYTGGDGLSASGFIINDPGSKTRTTLQQLLNVYPTFYKYFCY